MTENEKKSRRRFLADLLFLGGGLTAAAMLSKSLTPEETPVTEPTPIPDTSPTPAPELAPHAAGGRQAPSEPMIEGDMVMPQELEPVAEGFAPPVQLEPRMKGSVAIPQPSPDCRTTD